jgi:hypothetical protein
MRRMKYNSHARELGIWKQCCLYMHCSFIPFPCYFNEETKNPIFKPQLNTFLFTYSMSFSKLGDEIITHHASHHPPSTSYHSSPASP